MYTENDLVEIARRENNNKRNYLVVNKLQGKHVPVQPSVACKMFCQLADILKKEYAGEKILVVGFAETATGISGAVAVNLECDYMQTTREKIPGVDYFYFSETHSHATEQKLVKDDVDQIIDKVDRIIFVEDELTTGNTILSIIEIIKKQYVHPVKFAAASLINSMNKESEEIYRERGVSLHYLVKTNHAGYEQRADVYKSDGDYYPVCFSSYPKQYEHYVFDEYVNARRMVKGSIYKEACEKLAADIERISRPENYKRILVLGTEEFMYPALLAALKLEQGGLDVRFHATTRSPIVVSKAKNYPLHTRYELRSLYDSSRITFIYDLQPYDKVIVVTDAVNQQQEGLTSLLQALALSGNTNIAVVRWCSV